MRCKFIAHAFRHCLAAKKTYVHVAVTAVPVTWSSVKSRLMAMDGVIIRILHRYCVQINRTGG